MIAQAGVPGRNGFIVHGALAGRVTPDGDLGLSEVAHLRGKLVAAVAHRRSAGAKPAEAVSDYLREAAFTTLNRFVALKMLEVTKFRAATHPLEYQLYYGV